jgi:hypothetical protein
MVLRVTHFPNFVLVFFGAIRPPTTRCALLFYVEVQFATFHLLEMGVQHQTVFEDEFGLKVSASFPFAGAHSTIADGVVEMEV